MINEIFETYDNLINYFINLGLSKFNDDYLYVEKHHVIPISEGGLEEGETVYLPIRYHVMAHYLRGKEWEEKGNILLAWKNYNAVIYSLGQNHLPKSVIELEKKLDSYVLAKEAWMKINKEQGSIFVTDGKINKRLLTPESEIFLKENPPFKRGMTRELECKKWINDGKNNTYLPVLEAENFIKNNPNWSYGMAKTKQHAFKNGSMPPTTLGKKTIHKNGLLKNVLPEEIDQYIQDGWSIGHNHSPAKKILVISISGEKLKIFPKELNSEKYQGWKVYANS